MSQYIEVDVSTSMTWTFNALTIINDLLFAYFLNKISKRIPIPFQWEEDHNMSPVRYSISGNTHNAIDLRSLDQTQLNPSSSQQSINWNLHHNKYINKCCICLYKLTEPLYPSYFFDDITPDRRKELLENHWQTIQDQTATESVLHSPSRRSTHSTVPSYGGKNIFGITTKRMTGLIFKKRSSIQYLSLSLRLWSVALGIIAFALSWSFWMNLLLEYCIACVFNRGNYAQILGLLAVFAVVHCAMWWLKRQWQSLRLLWYNTSDHLNVSIGILWRFCNLLLCLSFTVLGSAVSEVIVSDSVFWQLFLRWMVIQGLLWELGYTFVCFLCNIWVMYRLYLLQYNFVFVTTLAKSHLKSIRKTINNVSNVFTEASIKRKKEKVETILEDTTLDEKEDEEEPTYERQLSDQEIHDLSQLHEIEATQQNVLQSMQSHSVHKSRWYTFLEVICALKENEDTNTFVCCNQIRLIYVKYLYIVMIFASIIVCFTVKNDDARSQSTFAGMIFIMYYFIVLFRRAKYNALYCFWSSKYHSRFYSNLQIIYAFETQKRMESRAPSVFSQDIQNNMHEAGSEQQTDEAQNDAMSVGLLSADVNPLSMDQAPAMDLSHSDESMEHKSCEVDEFQNKSNTDYTRMTDVQNAKMYSDVDNKEIIVFKDTHRNLFIKTVSIDYMDFWSMIERDDNDYYGCSVFCGATKEACGLLFALLFMMIFVATAITFSSSTHSANTSVYAQDATDKVIAPYPLCQVNWARNYLSLLDMVYITEVSYWSKKSEIKHMFNLWFANETHGLNTTGWDFNSIYIESGKPAFFHLNNTNGIQIVAVRGTYDMHDVLEDVSLYTEIATLQTFSWFIPLTTLLPVGFIRDFIKYASIPEGMIDPTLRDRYDEPIYEYVANNMKSSLSKAKGENSPTETIYVMGHSLGGGVAEIVAAKLADGGYTNVYSFGLSSPGTLWSSSKFGFSVEALDKSSISVLPRRDPVSMVDKHGGVSQVIECDAKEMLFCHMATRSFCEIYQECGAELVRNMTFTQCVCGNRTHDAKDWDQCW